MNIREAAGRLGISLSLAYLLCKEGRLRHVRIGGRGKRGKIVITEDDLAAFLAAARAETPPAAG
jgi:excisionase family DNA binding protein